MITADFGLSGTSAESPGGAGDDSVLKEWCCLVRRWRSQRQFKLTQLPDGQSLQMVIGTKIGFIRRQTLPEILCHLMNLLVGRQFLQASGALTGCRFFTTVFQCILAALQIPAFSGRMYGDIFILTQNTFPNEPLVDDLERFYGHLEQTLLATGFIRENHPGQVMNKLRRLFTRARPESQELNILRGILASIEQQNKGNKA